MAEVRVEEGVQTVKLPLQTNSHNDKTPSRVILHLGMPAIHQDTTSSLVSMQPLVLVLTAAHHSKSHSQMILFWALVEICHSATPFKVTQYLALVEICPSVTTSQGILHLRMLAFLIVHHGMAQSQVIPHLATHHGTTHSLLTPNPSALTLATVRAALVWHFRHQPTAFHLSL